ncbi:MAG: 23S rRNA (pseudouridine(1915)-N(3))-methyltransferase RlmH [Succiniclasticum sp.]|jgi:23S rRNA (pseudouridine1915-N3)-methyltransferase|nr:23S rRNA (pseudouridine(1915)-N(3))-methyltransferase RlmH [Succiniclasticum sp.]MCI6223279.1 23S rRNA (pseudouridine(1915)-N(3))-methyltransferase RlmH [Selenomonadales bacterium]MDY2869544.1 23S rRNA (pseudouridine(1915)-N(3))-methyltransferase RlmH [Succiniclasticum sp.]MDY6303200.1 23S rRNA (pseudouridine(1915)-N(3))-methyltransferase RlmH [Succiniclasticum sp.]MDY6345776.1 23S rRNA (pseudouridine(1915)-N(3))-methyltransferase RlmH [Succiniclasticum sp.]
MKITIACVGKLKEKYLTAGVEEYAKRLQPFCKLEITSISEEKMPQDPSDAEKEQVLAKETERLLKLIPEHSYVFLLDLQGQELTSPGLAAKMDGLALRGESHLTFVIGGAFGYTDELRRRADFRWSFSKLTFTHQMIRLLLVEQIYRAFKISHGEKYHW